jgi:hypothetical protein
MSNPRRIRWDGHAKCMETRENTNKALVGKPEGVDLRIILTRMLDK